MNKVLSTAEIDDLVAFLAKAGPRTLAEEIDDEVRSEIYAGCRDSEGDVDHEQLDHELDQWDAYWKVYLDVSEVYATEVMRFAA